MAQDKKKSFLEGILGKPPTTKQQTIAQIIGGAIGAGGIYGAFQYQPKSFEQVTSGVQSDVGKISPRFERLADTERAGLEADLGKFQAGEESKITTGLAARGITDPAVSRQAVASQRAGISSAYAAARAALTGAKLRAGSAVTSALSQYYMNLASKQYESQLQKYYGQMGLWGALGGLGTSLIGRNK